MLSRVILDTNIFIRYGPDQPGSFFMSAVVIQELTAGARDDATVRKLAAYSAQ